MAAGRILVPGWSRALDSDGDAIAARVSLFTTETDALATVYADEGLTIPLANPVQSNSAGRFPAIWADDSVVLDWSVEAPYGPPGAPFTGTGLTTALGADVLTAEAAEAAADDAEASAVIAAEALADIQALAAEYPDGVAGLAGKANITGSNITDSATFLTAVNQSASLAALLASTRAYTTGDTIQTRLEGYTYTVAASGATDHHLTTAGGVKLYVATPRFGSVPVGAFNAVGDGVTDDSAAFTKAINAFPTLPGFDILCEAKTYRIASAAIYFTRGIKIVGRSRQDGSTVLDFTDSVTVVNAPYNAHIIAVHSNNITGATIYTNPITLPAGQVGTYGEASGLVDLQVKCNPAIVGGIGVFANVAMDCSRVLVRNANLHCWAIVGLATNMLTRGGTAGPSGLNIGGNSNNGVYTQIWGRAAVNGDGIHCSGADANANLFLHADMVGCKGWGVNDASFLGNTWAAPHTADNFYGAYRTSLAAATSQAVFLGPYAEASQGTDNGGVFYEMSPRAVIYGPVGEQPEGALPIISGQLVGMQIQTDLYAMQAGDSVAAGEAFARLAAGLISMRTTDGKIWDIIRSGPTYSAHRYDGVEYMLLPNVDIGGNLRKASPFFANGISLGVQSLHTSGSAAPTTGTHAVGKVVWSEAPVAGGKVGWVCTTGGSPGTWKAFGVIDA